MTIGKVSPVWGKIIVLAFTLPLLLAAGLMIVWLIER